MDNCNHIGFWASHAPVPIQVQNGALLLTAMYCTNCGHVEYRSPPLSREDEASLQERMEEFAKKGGNSSSKQLSLPSREFKQ